MANRQEIIDKLLKVKELAEKGEAGERDGARQTYEKLKEKYGITDEEVKGSIIRWFNTPDFWQAKIVIQFGGIVKGYSLRENIDYYYPESGENKGKTGVRLSEDEFARLSRLYKYHKTEFKAIMDDMWTMYLIVNGISLAPELKEEEQKLRQEREEQQAKAEKQAEMRKERKKFIDSFENFVQEAITDSEGKLSREEAVALVKSRLFKTEEKWKQFQEWVAEEEEFKKQDEREARGRDRRQAFYFALGLDRYNNNISKIVKQDCNNSAAWYFSNITNHDN